MNERPNKRMNEWPNERMNEISNAERTAKRQTNDQTLIKRPNAEQTRKSEGKSIFESFKLWDYTMFKMIIQTKICNLFQIFNLAFSLNFIFFYKQGYNFFVFTGLQTGLYFFPKEKNKKIIALFVKLNIMSLFCEI